MSLPAALPGKPVRSRESKEDECDEENENNGEEDEDDEGGIEEMMSPLLLVSRDPFTNVLGEHALKTPDFMMVGNNVQLPQRAYYVRFVHPILQHQCILWSGYINLSKPQITMPGAVFACLLYVHLVYADSHMCRPCQAQFFASLFDSVLVCVDSHVCRPGVQHTGRRSGGCSSLFGWRIWCGWRTQAQPVGADQPAVCGPVCGQRWCCEE